MSSEKFLAEVLSTKELTNALDFQQFRRRQNQGQGGGMQDVFGKIKSN